MFIPIQRSVPSTLCRMYLSTSLSKVLRINDARLIDRYDIAAVLRPRLRINTTLVILQA